MTNDDIETAFEAAADDFNVSLGMMRPFRNEREGYCEANLIEYYSHALRQFGFRPFLEFPVPKGRIDALFYRDSTVLLVEAKQLYTANLINITADLARLSSLDLSALLTGYGFSGIFTERYHIALCDCWSEIDQQNWTAILPIHPFLVGYTTRSRSVHHGYSSRSYTWLLAYIGVA